MNIYMCVSFTSLSNQLIFSSLSHPLFPLNSYIFSSSSQFHITRSLSFPFPFVVSPYSKNLSSVSLCLFFSWLSSLLVFLFSFFAISSAHILPLCLFSFVPLSPSFFLAFVFHLPLATLPYYSCFLCSYF